MIRRFSSRRERLDTSFLNDRLKGAHAYDRIAGYFSSSILEVAGENLDQITGTLIYDNRPISVSRPPGEPRAAGIPPGNPAFPGTKSKMER